MENLVVPHIENVAKFEYDTKGGGHIDLCRSNFFAQSTKALAIPS